MKLKGLLFANVYLPSGTDGESRNKRQNYCAEIIPQMLVNRKESGCLGGDFNCITNKIDCTSHPEAKMSPSLTRHIRTFEWQDSFRSLYPTSASFSRYYVARGSPGATRIDRQYNWGNIVPVHAEYSPIAFSDHLAHSVTVSVPDPLVRMLCPTSRPQFKIREEIAQDREFKARVGVAMDRWKRILEEGLSVMFWWEKIVKPGVRKIAMERSKEINTDRRSELNLLLLRQAYLLKKIQHSSLQSSKYLQADLLVVQSNIQAWYSKLADKIKHQSRVDEFQVSEQTRIYHHEIHRKHLKRSSILKLQTETGLLEGHDACAEYLENVVADLLLNPAGLDATAQEILLSEIETVVTDSENAMLSALPTKQDVLETL